MGRHPYPYQTTEAKWQTTLHTPSASKRAPHVIKRAAGFVHNDDVYSR